MPYTPQDLDNALMPTFQGAYNRLKPLGRPLQNAAQGVWDYTKGMKPKSIGIGSLNETLGKIGGAFNQAEHQLDFSGNLNNLLKLYTQSGISYPDGQEPAGFDPSNTALGHLTKAGISEPAAPAKSIGVASAAPASQAPGEPMSPAAYPNMAKSMTAMANPPTTPPAANPTAPVAKTLPGAAPAMPAAPVAPAVKPSNPAGDYEAYLQRSIANPAASYEGPGGKVAVYRGRMPGSPTGDMSNAQFQEMRRIGLSQQLAALRGQESQGVEAQAKLLHGQAEMEHAKAANARVGVEMQKVQNERPGAAAEELFKHPERASSIGLLKGLTPEQAAVLGGSVKNAVSPQPISPLNYRSRLSEYPDLQRLLDDPTRKVHEVLAMARHFPGAEDPNNPIAQLIQAHYQNYLGGDENVRNLYADYLGQTPHERGESWLGYLSPFNIGGHAERARQADIVRSGLKQFNVPIPPRPSSF